MTSIFCLKMQLLPQNIIQKTLHELKGIIQNKLRIIANLFKIEAVFYTQNSSKIKPFYDIIYYF